MDIEQIRATHRPAKALSSGQRTFRDAAFGIVIGILVLGAGYQVWNWIFPEIDPAVEAAESDARDRKFVAEEGVRYYAKDPKSVQFREVVVTDSMVCGKYNAKNSFGAYAGFQRFVSDGKKTVTLEDDAGRDRMDALWQKHCQ